MIRVGSFFAGMGGFDWAFHKVGGFETVYANDVSEFALKHFAYNLPGVRVEKKDVWKIDPHKLPDFNLLCGGFPCQAFSQAGRQAGRQEARGRLFYALLPIISTKKPAILFLENVKGLKTFDNGQFLLDILQELNNLGYFCKYKVINAKDYGPPQNRERIYIVCFKNFEYYKNFDFPVRTSTEEERILRARELIDWQGEYDSEFYADTTKCGHGLQVLRFCEAVDFWPGDRGFRQMGRCKKSKNDIFYTLCRKTGIFDNMEFMMTNSGRVRSVTPQEALRIQGYEGYKLLAGYNVRRYYEIIGNSVAIEVIKAIAKNIKRAVGENERQ